MIAWHRDLETARTPLEVVRTAQAYVEAISSQDRATLPVELARMGFEDAAGLRAYGQALNDAYWKRREAGEPPGFLQELWSFFLRATIQLARLEGEAGQSTAGMRRREAEAA